MIFKLLGIVGGWPCEGAILAEGVSWGGKDFLGGLVHQGHFRRKSVKHLLSTTTLQPSPSFVSLERNVSHQSLAPSAGHNVQACGVKD